MSEDAEIIGAPTTPPIARSAAAEHIGYTVNDAKKLFAV